MAESTGQGAEHGTEAVEVILPCLDEEDALAGVLDGMPPGFFPIVIDNGSTDATADVARQRGAPVVYEPLRGFGAACWAGLGAARTEVVCFMDADGSLDPGDLPAVADPVIEGSHDLMVAARRADRGAWPLHARVANRYLAWTVGRRTGLALVDLGPMRAARREPLLALGMEDRRSGWPLEMVLRAAAAGWRIGQTVVPYRPRQGRSKVTGTLKGTVGAVRDMSRILREVRSS